MDNELSGKQGIPDYQNGIGLTQNYTAPQNGYVIILCNSTATNTGGYCRCFVDGVSMPSYYKVNYNGGQALHFGFPIGKNSVLTYLTNMSYFSGFFYPYKG